MEKQAGLKRSSVRNIINGFSKKPSAECLKSIADALGCFVDELLGFSDNIKGINNILPSTKIKTSYKWDSKLYLESVKFVSKVLEEKSGDLKLEQVTSFISESYKYSVDKGSDKIDHDFTKWLANKIFKN